MSGRAPFSSITRRQWNPNGVSVYSSAVNCILSGNILHTVFLLQGTYAHIQLLGFTYPCEMAKWHLGTTYSQASNLAKERQQEALVCGVIIPGGNETLFMQALNFCRFGESASLFKQFEMSILKAMEDGGVLMYHRQTRFGMSLARHILCSDTPKIVSLPSA